MKNFFFFLLLFFIGLIIVPTFLPEEIVIREEVSAKGQKLNGFNMLNKIKSFAEWSNLFPSDTMVNFSYFYPYEGVKSSFEWDDKGGTIGGGQLSIVKSDIDSLVAYEILFNGNKRIAKSSILLKQISENDLLIKWDYSGGKTPYFERYTSFLSKSSLRNKMKKGLITLKKKIESK